MSALFHPVLAFRSASRPTQRTAIGLILANLVPLVGVLVLGWSALSVVMAYVIETGIIGVYTLLRILLAGATHPLARLGDAVFFCVHFGLFFAIQTFFVFIIMSGGLALEYDQAVEFLALASGFLISHGQSFITHYLRSGAYRTASASRELFRPYGRIVVQQFLAIGGGYLVSHHAGEHVGPVVIVVLAKLVADLATHLWVHDDPRTRPPRDPLPG